MENAIEHEFSKIDLCSTTEKSIFCVKKRKPEKTIIENTGHM